jgi:hypothetical protein
VCRGRNFAPRLKVGDTVAYLTRKGSYGDHPSPHWRLVAVLRIKATFPTHRAAADWHLGQGLPLPNDCIVPENPPLPADHTEDPDADIAEWDAHYRRRTQEHGAFTISEPLWMDLYEPPVITHAVMLDVFGRVTPTRTPPEIPDHQFRALLLAAGVKPDGSIVMRPKTPVRPNRPTEGPRKTPPGAGGGCGRGPAPSDSKRGPCA